MTVSRLATYGIGMLPGIAAVVVSVVAAWTLGGPIAAAIVAFVAICALLIDAVLCLLFLHPRLRGSRVRSIMAGSALYAASVIVVLASLSIWGPSQIM